MPHRARHGRCCEAECAVSMSAGMRRGTRRLDAHAGRDNAPSSAVKHHRSCFEIPVTRCVRGHRRRRFKIPDVARRISCAWRSISAPRAACASRSPLARCSRSSTNVLPKPAPVTAAPCSPTRGFQRSMPLDLVRGHAAPGRNSVRIFRHRPAPIVRRRDARPSAASRRSKQSIYVIRNPLAQRPRAGQ